MPKPVPKPLPQRAAKEADTQYIERVFRKLYGKQKRVRPVKGATDAVHRTE